MEKLLCALILFAVLSGIHSRGRRIEGWIAFDADSCFHFALRIEKSSVGWTAEFYGVNLGRLLKTLLPCTCRRPRHA